MDHYRPCPECGSSDAVIKFVEPPFDILKCRNCSLVYLANPPEEGQRYEDYYAGPAPDARDYDANSTNPTLAVLYAINQQRIACIKAVQPAGRLLDIGCGRGFFLNTASTHGYQVEGIDISMAAIAYAHDSFRLTAEVVTIDDLAIRQERFDVITIWHVLEHFVDPFKTLQKVVSLLRDGGICVVEVPNLNSLKFLTAKRKWEGGNHPLYHRTFFTARTLRRALLNAGFRDVHRLKLSYRVPGRSTMYETLKKALNLVGMDAFLAFAATK
jgi:2-polyprenyl-3-methyl-5-hydroxy-6-metoxy-1,4-benzoquinol methylase